ncbi:MAG: HK97 family phage prohead protease [Pseudomonadota bacterium]
MFDDTPALPAVRDSGPRTAEISGYASVFGAQDLNGDIVERGAFARSLRRRPVRQIKMLYQHAADKPIGVWREVREDARGLFVRGELALDLPLAEEALSLLRIGAVDGLSIGFQAVRSRRERRSSIRRLIEVDLWEVSVVTFPMAPLARITSVRSAPAAPAARRPHTGADGFRQSTPPQSDVRLFTDAVRGAAHILRP